MRDTSESCMYFVFGGRLQGKQGRGTLEKAQKCSVNNEKNDKTLRTRSERLIAVK